MFHSQTGNAYNIGFKTYIQTTHQNSFAEAGTAYNTLLGN